MARDLELLPRIDEVREKNNIKIQVVEFSLNEIKAHFDENISNIEKSFEIVEKLQDLNEIEKSKNILRSQVVFLESAVDFYLHEISKCGIVKMFNGDWNKTERYNNLKVDMKLLNEAIKNPESYDWLLNYINEKIKREVYISYDSMKDQLNLLGIEFESVIKEAFNDYNGKQIIKDLFERRNEIAHQSDRNYLNAEENDITKEYVVDNIEYIKRFIYTIHDKVLKKQQE